VNEYFEGAIRQLQARARHLVSLIPRNLERDVDTLAVRCRDRIDAVIARLEILLSSPSMREPKNQGIRVRRFRRALDELDLLESVAVAALHRWGEADRRMNRLTHHIAREIRYPLITPVVVCLSPWRHYYLCDSYLVLFSRMLWPILVIQYRKLETHTGRSALRGFLLAIEESTVVRPQRGCDERRETLRTAR